MPRASATSQGMPSPSISNQPLYSGTALARRATLWPLWALGRKAAQWPCLYPDAPLMNRGVNSSAIQLRSMTQIPRRTEAAANSGADSPCALPILVPALKLALAQRGGPRCGWADMTSWRVPPRDDGVGCGDPEKSLSDNRSRADWGKR